VDSAKLTGERSMLAMLINEYAASLRAFIVPPVVFKAFNWRVVSKPRS